jgi:Rrf2 family nitric oxide-sensitive transcriptional repressor
MNLTRFTDYSLRTLLYVGMHPDRNSSIDEVSDAFQISRNHLLKVVHTLGRLGFLTTMRGRSGGLRLGRPPGEIRLGEVVRATEPGFELLECFDSARDRCVITTQCRLKGVLRVALQSFLKELDRHTLEDLLGNRSELAALFAPRKLQKRTLAKSK